MNPNPKNACAEHDWEPSLVEAGMLKCAWPGCRATRPAPVVIIEGVDIPVGFVVVSNVRAAA